MYVAHSSAQATDATTAVHFLEQSTFGPTAIDVQGVQNIGPQAWLNDQFGMPESPVPDGLDGTQLRSQLYLNMATGPDQLRQRAIFALSQIVVVSANKVSSGEELTPWVRLLSRNAFGNYRTLLQEVSLSPTMGKYLDNVFNRKATATTSPNENYARELLQLFSLGVWKLNNDGSQQLDGLGQPVPTYNQAVIKEFARAITGWTYPTKPGATAANSNPEYFVGDLIPSPSASRHDNLAKTVLDGVVIPAGLTAPQELPWVIDNIFNNANLPPFVVTRLIRSMVTSNPSPQYINRVVNVFINNGAGVRGDLRAVISAILLDPEALAPSAAIHGRLKDPVLHVIGFGRALGATIADPNTFQYVFTNLSERVLTPQTVFSFYSLTATLPNQPGVYAPEFQLYPPALAVQRANFIYGIITGQYGSAYAIDRTIFTTVADNATTLVDLVNQRLMMGRMSPQLRSLLITATNAVPASDRNQRAIGAIYLAAISSEYSVYGGGFTAGGVIPSNVQPPTGLRVEQQYGNMMMLKWTPPGLGPVPTGYMLEGSITPGAVIATVPTGSAATTFTMAVPTGSFYIRMRALNGGEMSLPGNEIKVNVNVPVKPAAPTNFQAVVKGRSLWLAWKNSYTGGEPTSLFIDATGIVTATVPLPLSEEFYTPSLPDGTITLRLRAVNAAGSSPQSSSISLNVPTTTCALPRVPMSYSAVRAGNAVVMAWDAPSGGSPATSYQIVVSGAYNGALPTSARGFAAAAPPGTYVLSVRAVNACGAGPATAFQTVVIP
ncbi:MAG: DUF1800 family protein [Acidobacteriota bacterium]